LEYIFFKPANDSFKLFPDEFAAGAYSLRDIYNVPKSLRIIGEEAFSSCIGLKFSNQLLGSNTIAIGHRAFL
jgi:hypothetical protein